MKGRTYALLALMAMAALAGKLIIDKVVSSADFRLVLTLKRAPEALVNAAFGSRKDVADLAEAWNPAETDDPAHPLPHTRFLLGRQYADGHWELEWEKSGPQPEEYVSVWVAKDGAWAKGEEKIKDLKVVSE